MKRTQILVIAISTLALLSNGCSHASKKSSESSAPVRNEASKPGGHALNSDAILNKYSLLELSSAQNMLKSVEEAGAKTPVDDKGTDIIGCPLAAKDARTSLARLESLIDRSIHNDASAYSADPKGYSSAFETCGGNCACDVYNRVLDEADTSSFKGSVAKLHARNKQHLAAKAKRIQPSERLACARKQNWYCSSDLKSYLEQP